MARNSKKTEEYDELDEAEGEYDDYDDDYDDYDDDYYEPRRKNPLKAFVIALLVLLVLMAAIIGLLYARLRSANDQVKELNASLEASRTEINNLLDERTATPEPVATPEPTPVPTPEPPEVTPEPAAQPGQEGTVEPAAQPTAGPAAQPAEGAQPTADPAAQPTADPAAQPTADPEAQPGTVTGGSPKDTVTDEMLKGVERPKDESWLAAPKNGVVTAFMLATHWGPGMNWYDNGALKEGTKVEILADQNGWLLLRTAEGVYGWAVGGFVKDA